MPTRRNSQEQVPLLTDVERLENNKQTYCTNKQKNFALVLIALAFVSLLGFTIGYWVTPHSNYYSTTESRGGIPSSAFVHGLSQCEKIEREKVKQTETIAPEKRKRNPRYGLNDEYTKPVLIQNAFLLDDGLEYPDVDILLFEGLVVKVTKTGERIKLSDFLTKEDENEVQIFNVEGRYVTPGLIDIHSHMGTDSWPGLDATSDTNEMSSPVTPFVRSIDGFNPDDPAIAIINSGGVTTSLVLPGSGNLIGGEAFVFKHRRFKTNLAEYMLLNAGMKEEDGKKWRYIKMACGENIKRSYGSKGVMPESRLGEGFLFRETFQTAQKLKEEQEDWCFQANSAKSKFNEASNNYIQSHFPEDTRRETVVALLRGDVKLHNHCYETYDLEMMVRHMHEFDFKVTTFHHALEAWMVAPLLHRENISTAIFADHWGYKKEAYGTSVHAGEYLTDAGVDVSYKSDHPVLNAQHLIFEAAKAHHYGLSAELALKSVTSVSAKGMGASNRIGRVQTGYDADVVVWDRHPLELSAHPLKVWVDGFSTFEHPLTNFKNKKPEEILKKNVKKGNEEKSKLEQLEATEILTDQLNYYVKNIKTIYADEKTTIESKTEVGDLSLVVKDGKLKCIGECDLSKVEVDSSFKKYDFENSVVTPGIIAGYGRLGIEEIPSERMTADGVSKGYDLETGGTRGVDGLRVYKNGSKELIAAFNAGVTVAVSLPRSSGLMQGLSVAFYTGEDNFRTAVLKEVTGVTVVMGNDAKDGATLANSFSGQLFSIRKLLSSQIKPVAEHFIQNKKDKYLSYDEKVSRSTFFDVVKGTLTLFVEAQEANDISRILKLKNDIESNLMFEFKQNGIKDIAVPKIKMTIVGGAEAWVVADDLAKNSVPVILRPARCVPGSFATRRCILPGVYPSATELLRRAGVKVSYANVEDNLIRGLMFEAGWAFSDSNDPNAPANETKMSRSEAIGTITWNAADALGIEGLAGRLKVGNRATFNVYSEDPLKLGSKLKLVADGKQTVKYPKQV
ncbi:hypothetical protein HK099_005841 [Clydaea vesicula]|uniref:Amidohydrolase-related domain-containing protein n=1 Tax=Clydaea vesicula TaxID=447962 RepID=A0AAD5TYL9_9FUNG|nr:hypothetical protein HK099_005841 [Clydaea vesicula]